MAGQHLDPLVVGSPTTPLFAAVVDQEQPQPVHTAMSTPWAQPPGADAAAATSGPCPVCRAEWLELRYQAGRWKSAFQRCRQRQSSLQEQAEIERQRLCEQAQCQFSFLIEPFLASRPAT